MSKPILKYVSLDWGCSITTGRDTEIRNYHGRAHVRSIRPATQKDVDWVRAMGGHVPEGRVLREKK